MEHPTLHPTPHILHYALFNFILAVEVGEEFNLSNLQHPQTPGNQAKQKERRADGTGPNSLRRAGEMRTITESSPTTPLAQPSTTRGLILTRDTKISTRTNNLHPSDNKHPYRWESRTTRNKSMLKPGNST